MVTFLSRDCVAKQISRHSAYTFATQAVAAALARWPSVLREKKKSPPTELDSEKQEELGTVFFFFFFFFLGITLNWMNTCAGSEHLNCTRQQVSLFVFLKSFAHHVVSAVRVSLSMVTVLW